MENNTLSMGHVGKNIIVGVIWLVIGYLIINTPNFTNVSSTCI